ncbi:MAG: 16S rRNA (adenine(1518)-N(6)/adenine(1519)-N(6))-dimethyltransferase RsmA [Desulfuromonadaceae bacterium]|nr:16S rRNA (adenine(1518)-N(6)/adenine(1519)-N(6))-dimethyltransferase RsmA [Desulfuromonadaceae bacterium]
MSDSHRPRKRFGQNFLKDNRIIDAIIAAAQLQSDDRVLEIGPGRGALTNRLLPRVGQLHIMEIDRDLVEAFQQRNDPRLQVHAGDALHFDWTRLLTQPPYKLVANLPYNISSQILFKMLEHRHLFTCMVLMFQKEVGDRLRAEPGTKAYGALTVLCQLWFDVERVVLVPPQCFTPAPKVMSEVLCFMRRSAPRVEVDDPAFFARVVKASFAQRRKTLKNSLKASDLAPESVEQAAQQAAIDLQRRGETLNLIEFARLAKALHSAT